MPPCESIITYETTIVVHCVYVFVYLTLAVIPHLVYLFDILFGVGVIVLSPTFCSHSVVLQPLLSVLTSQFNIFSPFTLQGKMFFQARLFSILSPTQFLQFLLSNLLFVKLRPLLSHVIPVMCVLWAWLTSHTWLQSAYQPSAQIPQLSCHCQIGLCTLRPMDFLFEMKKTKSNQKNVSFPNYH